MTRMFKFSLLLALITPFALHASRIKDLTLVDGGRDNQLVGYGLVVGLAGDGDSNAATTLRSVANVLQRYGLTINPTDIKAKNVAAVMLTADIGAFVKSGTRIDVNVASLGDAKSLQGGVLLQSPLLGADGRVYAVAQGPIALGGFLGGQGGAGGATVQKNHPTVGSISSVLYELSSRYTCSTILPLSVFGSDILGRGQGTAKSIRVKRRCMC